MVRDDKDITDDLIFFVVLYNSSGPIHDMCRDAQFPVLIKSMTNKQLLRTWPKVIAFIYLFVMQG